MVTVTLTDADLAWADYVGAQRHRIALLNKCRDLHPHGGFGPLDAHRQGARAEMAFATWSGLEWHHSLWDTSHTSFGLAGDVGGLEIRSTTHPRGRLVLHPKDVSEKGNVPFVLVVAKGSTFELVGWRRASSPPVSWWDTTMPVPAYFVPRSALHPMDTLPDLPARVGA